MKNLVVRCSSSLLSPFYSGVGSIVMLHRIVDDRPANRAGWCKDIEVSSATLEGIVELFRKRNYAFISMDEVYETLQKKPRTKSKFVAFTFDDGYRDVFTKGFPILRAAAVPFTLYLTTGFPDKTIIHWWYLLEALLLGQAKLSIEIDGSPYEFSLQSPEEKELAFAKIATFFENSTSDKQMDLAVQLFGVKQISDSVHALSMSWEDLKVMASNPLATIGAHTLNHPNLKSLSREEARNEMLSSKLQIEDKLRTTVRHFAYPFGGSMHAAEREFELARDCGFATATTTRLANIFPENREFMHSLPRLYAADPKEMEIQISGAISAFRFRGRRIVSV